jgi:hypothetical protein
MKNKVKVMIFALVFCLGLVPAYSQNALEFPSDFMGTWRLDTEKYGLIEVVTIAANIVMDERNNSWRLKSVAGDLYTMYAITYDTDYQTRTLGLKLVNGNLVISGDDSYTSWNGTGKKHSLTIPRQAQQLQNGNAVTGRLPSSNSEVWYSVTSAVNGFITISIQQQKDINERLFRLEIYDTQNNLLTMEGGENFDTIKPTEAGETYMIRLIYDEFLDWVKSNWSTNRNREYRIMASIEAFDPNPAPNSGDDFDITQNAQGGITITGYRGTRRQVVIPAAISGIKVTEISKDVFSGKGLFSVVIPNSVTAIGSSAFKNNNLTSVIIPNSVTTIASYAFSNNYLTSVTIPNSVTTAGSGAFCNNYLTSVAIPNSLTTIGSSTFRNNNLTSVTIPNSVTTIGQSAFSDNALTSVTFGNRVATIGYSAFADNNLKELTNLPASVTTISGGAFANNNITTVALPNNNSNLQAGAFADNPITALIIPAALAQTSTRLINVLGNSSGTLSSITIPANASGNSISGFPNNLAAFYESQGKKAGTYSWDGRLWSVR